VLRLSKVRTGQLTHRARCDFFKFLLQKTKSRNITIINCLIQYQILSFIGYAVIPELKKKIRQMGSLRCYTMRNLRYFQNAKWSCWRFRSSMMLHYDNWYKCINVSKDHSTFSTSEHVHQSAQRDILLQYGTSLLTEFTWYWQVSEDNANVVGQAQDVDKKNELRILMWKLPEKRPLWKTREIWETFKNNWLWGCEVLQAVYLLDRVYC